MFDIPAKWNKSRHFFPERLQSWGFIPLQRSVYVYPFDCHAQVEWLVQELKLKHTVKYMIAEIIEGEEDVISAFVEKGILTRAHFSDAKKSDSNRTLRRFFKRNQK